MLARYKIYRGKRPPADPQPVGIRQDTRWRTRHPLHPTQDIVERYLASPTEEAWRAFRAAYLNLLDKRFSGDRESFDRLADLARANNVFIGCSCPTEKNPRVDHCHTWLALEFMKHKYPDLTVDFPSLDRVAIRPVDDSSADR